MGSEQGRSLSYGIMVNYRYDPGNVHATSVAYRRDCIVAASRAALLLQAMGSSMFEGGLAPHLQTPHLPTHGNSMCTLLRLRATGVNQSVLAAANLPVFAQVLRAALPATTTSDYLRVGCC